MQRRTLLASASAILMALAVPAMAQDEPLKVGFMLPAAWIERVAGDAVVALGLRRTGAAGVADAPFASVPWRTCPRLLGIDLLGGGARVGETLYSAP